MTHSLSLPKFIFLNAPPGSGKTTLAELLIANHEVCKLSFADPIRMALTATFYPDNLYTPSSLNLADGETKKSLIPGTQVSHRKWIVEFGRFMHLLHGESIFGQLAHRATQEQEMYYRHFLFDDLRTPGDIEPFIRNEGVFRLLIIQIQRPGCSWTGDLGNWVKPPDVRVISIQNAGEPADMLTSLKRELERLPA